MNLEQSFIADILAHPDDPAPRLIFADWLQEQGHTPATLLTEVCRRKEEDAPRWAYAALLEQSGDWIRAEYIRTSLELRPVLSSAQLHADAGHDSATCRESRLVRREANLWLQYDVSAWTLAPWAADRDWTCTYHSRERAFRVGKTQREQNIWCYVHGGFIEVVELTAEDAERYLTEIVAQSPIREVRLTTTPKMRVVNRSFAIVSVPWRHNRRLVESAEAVWGNLKPLKQRFAIEIGSGHGPDSDVFQQARRNLQEQFSAWLHPLAVLNRDNGWFPGVKFSGSWPAMAGTSGYRYEVRDESSALQTLPHRTLPGGHEAAFIGTPPPADDSAG